MPLRPLPFPNDGKTNMILFYIVNKSRSSSLKSIGSGCHFFCLLVIPLRFQVITRTKPFEGNGTSQKEHDICTAKQTLYISAKINMHKSYFDIITLLNHTNFILISINSIFYEIKRNNYLYGNVIT